MICDFCSQDNPTWEYTAKDFRTIDTSVLIGTSHGSWAACDICHKLIEESKFDELANRSAKLLHRDTPFIPYDICLTHIRALHNKFKENRTGVAKRIVDKIS